MIKRNEFQMTTRHYCIAAILIGLFTDDISAQIFSAAKKNDNGRGLGAILLLDDTYDIYAHEDFGFDAILSQAECRPQPTARRSWHHFSHRAPQVAQEDRGWQA